jgi:hypothetical protein
LIFKRVACGRPWKIEPTNQEGTGLRPVTKNIGSHKHDQRTTVFLVVMHLMKTYQFLLKLDQYWMIMLRKEVGMSAVTWLQQKICAGANQRKQKAIAN